jgi:hypothetical protein
MPSRRMMQNRPAALKQGATSEPLNAALEFVSATKNCARNEETNLQLSPVDGVEDHHHKHEDDQRTDDPLSRSSEHKHPDPPY